MSAETSLSAALLGAASVTAIVGSGSSARIYPDNVPQEKAAPCIAYSRTGTEYIGGISGPVFASRASLEVWCMAASRSAAEQLADAVQTACIAAQFTPTGRRAEFDPEAELWAAVLAVDFWS